MYNFLFIGVWYKFAYQICSSAFASSRRGHELTETEDEHGGDHKEEEHVQHDRGHHVLLAPSEVVAGSLPRIAPECPSFTIDEAIGSDLVARVAGLVVRHGCGLYDIGGGHGARSVVGWSDVWLATSHKGSPC